MMTVVELSASTTNWVDVIGSRLAAGEHALVRFETPTITPREMADSIGISRQAIMHWIAEGKIAMTRRGNRHRITTTEVERFRSWCIQDLANVSAADALTDLFGAES